MPSGSLRARLLVGAMLGAVGLIALAAAVTAVLVHQFPNHLTIVHSMLVSTVAIALLAAGWMHMRRSLSPVAQVRDRLADVREGRAVRITGHYPDEIDPLVAELNALVAERDDRVARALGKAGDLAHGLKTPLAVLTREADRAEADGHADLADGVRQQVARMQRQVTYHLAQARAAAAGASLGARTPLAEAARGLIRVLDRIHAERGIVIDLAIDDAHAVRCQREDVEEMLGNLLDNACKWARARVRASSRVHDGFIVIDVDDDGPGLEATLREAVLQRGVKADESGPGSGLGLAIVRDLAHLYGGSIALSRSPTGGLRAQLTLPAAGRTL